ncbi:MAG: hypothetical protein HQK99_02220 [Nitrospirae bacterium]|nr:hypothetical protein [Nitrospirota bacterium]
MRVMNKIFFIFEGETDPTEFYKVNKKIQAAIDRINDGKEKTIIVVDFSSLNMAPSSFWGILATALRSPFIESIELMSVQSSIKMSIERFGFNEQDKIKVFPMFNKNEVEVGD